MVLTGLMFLLAAGLLIAVPVAAGVAWLSARGQVQRFDRVLAFASAGVLATFVAYVASGMMQRASGLLLAEQFTDAILLMAIGALLGSVVGARRTLDRGRSRLRHRRASPPAAIRRG